MVTIYNPSPVSGVLLGLYMFMSSFPFYICTNFMKNIPVYTMTVPTVLYISSTVWYLHLIHNLSQMEKYHFYYTR